MDQIQSKLLKVAVSALSADAQGGKPIEEGHIVDTVLLYAPIAGQGLSELATQEVIEELTKRFNVWTGKAGTLLGDDPGHKDWLPARRSSTTWRFWNRYRLMLESGLAPRVVNELDEMTDQVLGLLEDPARQGTWRRQGLVVGHVQSGKTGNYTGLICKAADVGYKVIIVLSGIHNSLRSQTQIRLDEGFLGYARPFGENDPTRVPVGVGLIDGTPIADSVTTREERGDFSKAKAQGFQIHAGGNVLLFVVKKNVRVLRNLIEWARLSAKKHLNEKRIVVGDVPLLVIDDEADQASIDTKIQAFDEETGLPDQDHDPTAINHLIRRLLETFERRAYVGYTATPFANVFIHPEGRTAEGGEDLFPKHFIVNLSAPSNYFGPVGVFGSEDGSLPAQGDVPSRIRFVDDADQWVPPSHKNGLVPLYGHRDAVPPSLERAVRAFLLSSAARRARGQVTDHKSMLIHVTRFTAVQQHVHRQIRQLVEDIKTRWRARQSSQGDPLAAELQGLWEIDFNPTSEAHGQSPLSWELVEPHIWPVLDLLKVNLINAKATDALIYEEHKSGGLHVIAVGGDKLSRGLTLEGLSVSYFLRSARMYDTLMQMGRWFGYRLGYEDLCRLYLTEELAEWYGHITEAAEELRQEFDRMVLLGGTPDDYGLRVRTHPVLAITGKLRPGLPTLTTSLSATPFEPTVLLERAATVDANWERTLRFVGKFTGRPEHPVSADDPPGTERRGSWPGALMWRGVPGQQVLDYLKNFEFADKHLTRTPSTAVTAYISDRLQNKELAEWTVVVLGKASMSPALIEEMRPPLELRVAGEKVLTIYRGRARERPGYYIVKRLGSPRDETIDLSGEEWKKASALIKQVSADPQRPDGPKRGRLIRDARPRERGLMILYLLTPSSEEGRDDSQPAPLVAPYISFPFSPGAKPVNYQLSFRYWEEELRGVE